MILNKWMVGAVLLGGVIGAQPAMAEIVVDFEELPFGAAGGAYEAHYNGDPDGGGRLRDNYTVVGESLLYEGTQFESPNIEQVWTSGGVTFNNEYATLFGSWTGWSWSRATDMTTPNYENQYSAITGGGSLRGGGVDSGGSYAVAFGNGAFFNLPDQHRLSSIDVTNTTYAGLAMRDGDSFSDPYRGGDFFRAVLTGYDRQLTGTDADLEAQSIGAVTVDLADFTGGRNFILMDWEQIDLAAIAEARSVGLAFDSSNPFTPTYMAVDNLRITAVPEPAMLLALSGLACGIAVVRIRRCRSGGND